MINEIPKVIHYCWFGGNPLPELAIRCIESWKKYCPDYEIIEWNESNFDLDCCPYVREAYNEKKWAFVTDYARLKIVYEHGGLYFDTDVELIKPIDDLLDLQGFMGFEDDEHVNTGVGFGAIPGHSIIKSMMDDYTNVHFRKDDGTLDMTPCPIRNTQTLVALGLYLGEKNCELQGIKFYPKDFFSPKDMRDGKIKLTKNTYSIHHYSASWYSKKKAVYAIFIRTLYRVFGEKIFGLLRRIFGKGRKK